MQILSSGNEATALRDRPLFRLAALALFSAQALGLALHLSQQFGRHWAFGIIVFIVGGYAVRRRPWVLAGVIIGGSLALQLAYLGTNYSDQTDLGRAAFAAMFRGETPYQIHDMGRHLNPFPYGPLAMLTAQGGVPLEMAAGIGLLVLLAWSRSWITFGLVAGFPTFVYLATSGINDYLPALLIVAALILLERHVRTAMVVLAISIAVKPYAAAWVLPAVGFAGIVPTIWLMGASVLLWLPVAPFWMDFLRMVRVAAGVAGYSPWRIVGPPLALVGLVAARWWSVVVLLGSCVFASLMLFGPWVSRGYLTVMIPVAGIGLERLLHRLLEQPMVRVRLPRAAQ